MLIQATCVFQDGVYNCMLQLGDIVAAIICCPDVGTIKTDGSSTTANGLGAYEATVTVPVIPGDSLWNHGDIARKQPVVAVVDMPIADCPVVSRRV